MTEDFFHLFACELCGGGDFADIPEAAHYTGGQPIHVCKTCGFVQVIRRRSADRIGEVWSKELFQNKYTARIPAVIARQVYVAETIDVTIPLNGKTVCDIGAGEGYFLEMLREDYGAKVFGVEPSGANCTRMRACGIECFDGTAEDFYAAMPDHRFDIVTVIWTLENSNSCRGLMDIAWHLLNPGGHVVVATGSRILVPFKKSLSYYLGRHPADTHAFRFSANTLHGLLAETGFEKTYVNQYVDSDVLCMIGKRTDRSRKPDWRHDDWRRVLEFFSRWHKDTEFYANS